VSRTCAKGIAGLAAQAQLALKRNPASGAVFCFRGRRGDRLKLLFRDGQGFCLYCKVLEKGRFPWPSPADGAALRLTSAQLSMLWGEWANATGSREPANDRLAATGVVLAAGAGRVICSRNQ
jgi:transposase